jgi:hypothetical protein
VGPKRGPLCLVNTTEELLERKSSCSGLKNRDYGLRGSSALTMGTHLSTCVCIESRNIFLRTLKFMLHFNKFKIHSGYRSRGPDSISGAITFSEK